MRARYTFALTALSTTPLLYCGRDTPTASTSCLSETGAIEIEVWRDSAVLVPRSPAQELLSPTLWQGIKHTMSRGEVEAVLAQHLRSRKTYGSEFNTPLGKLQWSLDREASGGDEVRIPRIYLYPRKLTLNETLNEDVVMCLRKDAPNAKYVIVMSGAKGRQLATIVVDGLAIKRVVWQQTRV